MLLPMTGLGAACSPILSMDQIYQLARGAGFPPDVAVQMTAIAMRESAGCPNAHNPGTLGVQEDSYGLWQINALANPGLLASMGISAAQLLDPATNAAAAYQLWGGSASNLNTAWAINKSGPPYYYAEKYQQYLPAAQLAAARVDGSGGTILASSPGPGPDYTPAPAGSSTGSSDTAGSIPAPAPTLASMFTGMFSGSVTVFGTEVPVVAIAGAGLALGLLFIALTSGSSRRRR